MSYKSEAKFEEDLARMLVEEKGWKDGVLHQRKVDKLKRIRKMMFVL